jgi:hypothetical protein
MAFRSGSVTGTGAVYSRRRGRGFGGVRGLGRGKVTVILEESGEDSDPASCSTSVRTTLQSQPNYSANAHRTGRLF